MPLPQLRIDRLTSVPHMLPCGVIQAELSRERARYDDLLFRLRELERLRTVGFAHGFDVDALDALIVGLRTEMAF